MSWIITNVHTLSSNAHGKKGAKLIEYANAFKYIGFTDYDAYKAFLDSLAAFVEDLNKMYPRTHRHTVKISAPIGEAHITSLDVIPEGRDNSFKSEYAARFTVFHAGNQVNPFYFESEEYLELVERIKKGGEQ